MKKLLLIIPMVALLAAGCGKKAEVNVNANNANEEANANVNASVNGNTNQSANSQIPTMVKVDLSAQNNSGMSGSATITEVQGKAKVILNITGAPSGVTEPAHIHFGSCADLGGVKYPLTSVSAGASQTILPVSLAELIAEPFAINVHKSAAESNVYVACGDSLKMNKSGSADTNANVNAGGTNVNVNTKANANY